MQSDDSPEVSTPRRSDPAAGEPGAGPMDPGEQEEGEPAGFTVNDRRFWTQESEDDSEGSAEVPSFVEQLQNRLEEKDRQLREYIAAYKTEVVEGMEKTKQRLERDSAQQVEQLRGKLAEPMMEVLDALERSITAVAASPTVESMLQGIKLVHQLMLQKLLEMGLSRIDTVGHPFDPQLHEAVAVAPVDDPAQDNIILNELKPGFVMGDRLVRAALVQVGKKQ